MYSDTFCRFRSAKQLCTCSSVCIRPWASSRVSERRNGERSMNVAKSALSRPASLKSAPSSSCRCTMRKSFTVTSGRKCKQPSKRESHVLSPMSTERQCTSDSRCEQVYIVRDSSDAFLSFVSSRMLEERGARAASAQCRHTDTAACRSCLLKSSRKMSSRTSRFHGVSKQLSAVPRSVCRTGLELKDTIRMALRHIASACHTETNHLRGSKPFRERCQSESNVAAKM